MNATIVEHNRCRLCKSNNLIDFYSLGDQFVNDFPTDTNLENKLSAPLELIKCNDCDLVQLRHTAPQELLYSRNYWYESGINESMKESLNEVVKAALNEIPIDSDDFVLDIGANDGTLLSNLKNTTTNRIACEPALNLTDKLRNHCEFLLDDFWNIENLNRIMNRNMENQVKIIFAIGMFYDLEDPKTFLNDISKTLHKDGIFIAQMMSLVPMLENNDFMNICHEHIEYYSYKSLKYLYENCGLSIYKIETNEVNGGSYRIYARKSSEPSIDYHEPDLDLLLENFIKSVELNKKQTIEYLNLQKSNGKTIHVYGASTKGNVLLQFYDLNDSIIDYAVDRNPKKHGKYTIGSNIKIIDEEASRKMNPDFYLVLPYSFMSEFIQREKEWLLKGGNFITTTPNFEIIGKDRLRP